MNFSPRLRHLRFQENVHDTGEFYQDNPNSFRVKCRVEREAYQAAMKFRASYSILNAGL